MTVPYAWENVDRILLFQARVPGKPAGTLSEAVWINPRSNIDQGD